MDAMINIEIAYANLEKQALITLQVAKNYTIQTAIEQSGILKQFPEIDLGINKVGIFSKTAALTTVLHEGDRVEIYYPLLIDPKAARKARAKRQKIKI